jgi:omega-hydroxy-beta-dihydromenaquinone-9 sulfotransferase
MITGWDRPQEDEFALANMGIPSPYITMAFPNQPASYPEYLDLENISPTERRRWQDALLWFLQRVTYYNPKRIILKSPPHLARIKAILEVFPDARFVHIVRDPYVLFQSTVKLWKAMYTVQALQVPNFEHLDEYVYSCFETMYKAFETQKHLVPEGRLSEVRYEDLVGDTMGQMRRIYNELELGEFENVAPRLEEYLAQTKNYKTNQYSIAPEIRNEVDRRWGRFMQRYGYCDSRVPAREIA